MTRDQRHIVAIRFSAMGDVAMCVPVVSLLLEQHPELTISFVSDQKFAPLFSGMERCRFIGARLRQEHRGITGLFRLYRTIARSGRIDGIADLHGVIRSSVIKFFFQTTGKKVVSINKGRDEKKQLTRKKNKKLQQLKSGFQRYADVFRQLGYELYADSNSFSLPPQQLPESVTEFFQNRVCIGIAPFARHAEKMYNPDKMKLVVQSLAQSNVNILLFGGGAIEKSILDSWVEEAQPNVINTAGSFSLQEELAIISNLKLMVSMDSANMHLASLFKVPVISVWGPTHPFAGFFGWNQSEENIISMDLPCRPCSVYGDKKCYRGDHACMEEIRPDQIISRIRSLLSNQN